MRLGKMNGKRRGAIVPLVAISLVALLGMVALAIDIGMVAVAKSQAQNGADSAALVGARSFNQQAGYNLTNVPKASVTAAVANKIFASQIKGDPKAIANPSADVYTAGDVKLEFGGYYYVYDDAKPANEGFQQVFPPQTKAAAEPYTAVRATITTTSPIFFGAVFGANPFNVKATAVGAHRPRDVVIIMDLSGSMRFQSCPAGYLSGGNLSPNTAPRNKSLNPDTLVPTFGHYSSASAALIGSGSYPTGGGEQVDQANLTATSISGPPIVPDFMSSGSTPAFASSSSSYATTPGGDNYLGASVKTVTDFLGATPTQTAIENYERGVTGYAATFKGYTAGPGYWGKTFFVWPPDPRGSDMDATDSTTHANNGAKDWRQRFFFKKNTSTNTLYWLDHNNILFDPTGAPGTSSSAVTPIMKMPNTSTTVTENGSNVTYRYCINYAAIFQWLRNSAPTHFPSAMTTGRIKFYSTIPNPSGDTGFNNRFWTQNPMTDINERFWKDYVDFMLGMVQTGANTYKNNYSNAAPYTACIGPGDMFAWGTVQVTQRPDADYKATINSAGGYTKGSIPTISLNNVQTLSGTAIDLPGPNPITGATNAKPIVITSSAHGLTAGQYINISGVLGNTAANNSATANQTTWKVGTVTTNTFEILTTTGGNTTGNGTYTANTGIWVPAITNASNTTPIVITTGAPHNIPSTAPATSGKFTITITGVTGNAAANGRWLATRTGTNTFSLDGSAGNGNYTTSSTQYWEPIYYFRANYGSSFYELNPATVTSGILTGTPDIPLNADVPNSAVVQLYTAAPKFMDYADNTYRPRHQFWFGPMTFVDWLGNYTINKLRWPGNVHEAQAWACKVGISSSIDDIKNNHPNDYVGMAFFSSPNYSTGGGGQHNQAVVPLGRNYQNLKDSLWFPPSTVAGAVSTITPYDSDFNNVPRANGGTAPGMGFMITYNLLSSSVSNLRNYASPSSTYRGYAGGLGRKGASRIVIFETDGAPNTAATKSITGSSSDSYYPVRIENPASISDSKNEFPSNSGNFGSDVFSVVQQICALETAAPPGYSSTRKPAAVYSLGYGSLFDPATTSGAQSNALTFLQTIQYNGNTSKDMVGANFPDWQRIYGDTTTRQTRMQAAFTKIMQSGVQVSLIQ